VQGRGLANISSTPAEWLLLGCLLGADSWYLATEASLEPLLMACSKLYTHPLNNKEEDEDGLLHRKLGLLQWELVSFVALRADKGKTQLI